MGIDAAFSHGTAARLLGVPLPFRLEREPRIHIAVRPPRRAPRVDGIVGHQLDLGSDHIVRRCSFPVTSPERTWCDLAVVLSARELVAVGDFLIARNRPLTSRDRLGAIVRQWSGRRGAAKLVAALGLLSERAESPPESILRVMLVEAGLPRLDVNLDLRDGSGAFLARPDLRFPDYRLIVEYEGDGHRADRQQWRSDFGRTARLQVFGEEVLRVGAADLRDEAALLAVVRALLIRRGWRQP